FAFISRKLILDSFLITNEVVDLMCKNQKGGILLKVDFGKAYYNVCWDFLKCTMKKLRFSSQWCKWVMECVKTTLVFYLVYRLSTKSIKVQRSCIMGKAMQIGICKGIRMEDFHNMKNVLRCFQLMSRLKINFTKSYVYGVGIEKEVLESKAIQIHYKLGFLPTTYLGLPLRKKLSSLKF
ncbi:hypothetical protein SCA6_000736, partial [Theobroma cacao]